jgi:hypothetical protein
MQLAFPFPAGHAIAGAVFCSDRDRNSNLRERLCCWTTSTIDWICYVIN